MGKQAVPTAVTEEEEHIFDSAFYRKVSRLKLAITQKSTLEFQGRRRTALKGSSAEFSDFREYLPGDDVRRIDWNVYARLDKPYVREYMEERESSVNIFLDMSASMAFWGKELLAKQLAGALALAALSHQDRVGLNIVSGEKTQQLRLSGGKGNVKRALLALEEVKAAGSGDLAAAVRGAAYLPRGMTILLSDFCEESFLAEAQRLCRYLQCRGQEVVLMQISASEERRVTGSGTFRLEDSEGVFDAVRLSLDRQTVEAYEKEYAAFLEEVGRVSEESGSRYYLCRTEDGFDRILLEQMKNIMKI